MTNANVLFQRLSEETDENHVLKLGRSQMPLNNPLGQGSYLLCHAFDVRFGF